MKKILGVFLIIFLGSCNSNLKAEKQLLEEENELLRRKLEWIKKEKKSDSIAFEIAKLEKVAKPEKIVKLAVKAEKKGELIKKTTGYIFENFHISENRVGVFSKGMTISDVYNTLPKQQIKKVVGYGEFADETFDNYEIYDSTRKKILVLTPKQNGNTNSEIEQIVIYDNRFETTEKIGLSSTFEDFAKYYSTDDISHNIESINIDASHIDASFSIMRTELQEGWWNGKVIDKSKIPNTAKFSRIWIWWK